MSLLARPVTGLNMYSAPGGGIGYLPATRRRLWITPAAELPITGSAPKYLGRVDISDTSGGTPMSTPKAETSDPKESSLVRSVRCLTPIYMGVN